MTDSDLATTARQFSLHVIAGEQKGASIELQNRGSYSLGASEDCSIVLVGDGLADVHIESVFLDDVLNILDCENDVRIDGLLQNTTPFTLTEGQLLSFADITVVIGNNDIDLDEVAEKANEEGRNRQAEVAKVAAEEKKIHKGRVILLSVAVGMVASVGLLGWWLVAEDSGTRSDSAGQQPSIVSTQSDQSEQLNEGEITLASQLDQVLASDDDFSKVMVANQLDESQSRAVIRGVVASVAILEKLRKKTINFEQRPIFEVVVHDQFIADAKVALRKYDAGLVINLIVSNSELVLRLEGISADDSGGGNLQKIVSNNLPIVDRVEIDVKSVSQLQAGLSSWQNEYPRFAGLSFDTDAVGKLVVSGTLLANYRDSFEKELDNILKEYEPNSMSVEKDVKIGPRFAGRIVSILISSNASFATIEHGSKRIRASVGSELGDGIVIKEINRSHLLVGSGGNNYYLSLT